MKIFDSSNLPVQALALGSTLVLTAIAQGTPQPAVAVSASNGHMVVSNPLLEWGGRNFSLDSYPTKGGVSQVALSGVVNTDSLTIGGKTYVAGTDFTVGGSDTATCTNLAAAINTPQTGAQAPWVWNCPTLNFQGVVSGTGAVASNVDIEHSADGQTWTSLTGSNLFTLSGTTKASAVVKFSGAFSLIRVNLKSLTAGNRIQIWADAA